MIIYVENQDEAVKFFVDKVGFVKTYEQEIIPGFRWIEVALYDNYETTLIIYSKKEMEKTSLKIAICDIMFSFYNQDGNTFLIREGK